VLFCPKTNPFSFSDIDGVSLSDIDIVNFRCTNGSDRNNHEPRPTWNVVEFENGADNVVINRITFNNASMSDTYPESDMLRIEETLSNVTINGLFADNCYGKMNRILLIAILTISIQIADHMIVLGKKTTINGFDVRRSLFTDTLVEGSDGTSLVLRDAYFEDCRFTQADQHVIHMHAAGVEIYNMTIKQIRPEHVGMYKHAVQLEAFSDDSIILHDIQLIGYSAMQVCLLCFFVAFCFDMYTYNKHID
jgi:hypothetical protein